MPAACRYLSCLAHYPLAPSRLTALSPLLSLSLSDSRLPLSLSAFSAPCLSAPSPAVSLPPSCPCLPLFLHIIIERSVLPSLSASLARIEDVSILRQALSICPPAAPLATAAALPLSRRTWHGAVALLRSHDKLRQASLRASTFLFTLHLDSIRAELTTPFVRTSVSGRTIVIRARSGSIPLRCASERARSRQRSYALGVCARALQRRTPSH